MNASNVRRNPAIYLLILAITLLGAESAWAAGNCPDEGFTARLVECITVPLQTSSEMLFFAVYQTVAPAIYGFMVLATALFGLKLASNGVQRPFAETAMLGIKLVAVGYVTQNFVLWYPDIIAAIDDTIRIVTKPFTESLMSCPGTGPDDLWGKIDCLLLGMLGLGIGAAAGGAILGQGLSSFIGTFMAGQSMVDPTGMGAAITAAAVGMLFTLFFGTFKLVIAFIAAKIALAFMIALAPIFMPLILLQATKNYFMQWLYHTISYAIQPFLLYGFLSFGMIAVNTALFTGDYSLANAVLGHPVDSVAQWEEELLTNLRDTTVVVQQPGAQGITTPQYITDDQIAEVQQQLQENVAPTLATGENRMLIDEGFKMANQLADNVLPTMRGVANIGISVSQRIDPMNPEVLITMVSVTMVCYILFMISDVIADIARDISGSFSPAALGRSFDVPGERGLYTLTSGDKVDGWVKSLTGGG